MQNPLFGPKQPAVISVIEPKTVTHTAVDQHTLFYNTDPKRIKREVIGALLYWLISAIACVGLFFYMDSPDFMLYASVPSILVSWLVFMPTIFKKGIFKTKKGFYALGWTAVAYGVLVLCLTIVQVRSDRQESLNKIQITQSTNR